MQRPACHYLEGISPFCSAHPMSDTIQVLQVQLAPITQRKKLNQSRHLQATFACSRMVCSVLEAWKQQNLGRCQPLFRGELPLRKPAPQCSWWGSRLADCNELIGHEPTRWPAQTALATCCAGLMVERKPIASSALFPMHSQCFRIMFFWRDSL